MVEDSFQVLQVLKTAIKNRKTNNKAKEPSVDQSSNELPDSSRLPGGMKPGPFPQRKPDRFPEGPMFDKRSRNRFYYY